MKLKKSNIAAQLYTIRDHLKTPEDIKSSLKKVRRIGYEAVQLSGLGPIDEEELKKILSGEGIVACSTHEPSDEILSNPKQVADKLGKLQITSTAYPFPAGINFSTISGVRALAKKLDKAGAILRDAGIELSYHNHHIEFRRIRNKPILAHIYEMTSPENLKAEIDTYWVQAGGGDPVDWLRTLKGRMSLVHLKDLGIDEENKQVFEEIGSGNLQWKEILSAASSAGCKWYIVEQDANFQKADPFKSLKSSFEFLTKNFC